MSAHTLVTPDGELTPRATQLMALAHLPRAQIALEMGISPASVKVYLSRLRAAGFDPPRRMKQGSFALEISVPETLAQELLVRAARFGGQSVTLAAMVEMLLTVIDHDRLLPAVLDQTQGRAA